MAENIRDKIVAEMETWLNQQKQAVELLKSLDSEVLTAAVTCLESPLEAGKFLTTPARSLDDKIPVEVAKTPQGKKQVMRLIAAIEHGVYL